MTHTVIDTRDGTTAQLPEETLETFRQELRGPLVTPTDEHFEESTHIWNGMIERSPALVVQPTGTADIVAAVNFAREHDLLLSVKGGGHNIAGTALADGGLTIDMSRLRGVVVDPDTRIGIAQGGCLVGDLDREAQVHGLATPLGFISETGLAGLTLGGGFGYLTRRFGWTVDNLLEVEVVTADGTVRRASREENEDLFWAICGAGHNFGVVTSFTFQLYEVGPTVYGGLIAWPFERASEILGAYREITAEAPRELTIFLVMRRAPPAPFVPEEQHGKRICAMAICYTGDLNDVDEVMAPIRALGDPIVDLLAEQPYTQLQSYLDGTQPKGNHYYWKTEFVSEIRDDLLSTTRELAKENPIPGGQVAFAHIGGALNECASDDGAVGNRDARYVYMVAGMWESDDPNGERYRTWVTDAWKRFRPLTTGGNYINFQTADEGDERIRATYGENYDRIARLKERYDPENVFSVNRNIQSA
ncbi:FAD-binding oxidoreductase [Natronorarus salvus]|uniref:FAD-binding oxidoreductase n=1 Tax=Natronorarus salvus TaxID=3117733 RepID=UPI002F2629FE